MLYILIIPSLKGCLSGLHIRVFSLGTYKLALSARYDNVINLQKLKQSKRELSPK